eukprot:gene3063-3890_t
MENQIELYGWNAWWSTNAACGSSNVCDDWLVYQLESAKPLCSVRLRSPNFATWLLQGSADLSGPWTTEESYSSTDGTLMSNCGLIYPDLECGVFTVTSSAEWSYWRIYITATTDTGHTPHVGLIWLEEHIVGAVKLFEDLAGGAVGHSCADTCAAAGMVCAQASFRERISAYNPSDAEYAAMFQVVGMTCGSISRELNAAVLPMWTSGGTCYVASDSSGSLATCDTVAEAEEDARRMCFCSPSAGQHSCWSHPDVQGIDTAGSTAPFGLAHSAALDALNLNSFNVTVITTLTDAASGRSWAPLWFASSGGEDPSLPGLRLGDAAGGANTVLMVGMADGTSSSSRSFEFVNPLTAGVETTFQLVCSRVDSGAAISLHTEVTPMTRATVPAWLL